MKYLSIPLSLLTLISVPVLTIISNQENHNITSQKTWKKINTRSITKDNKDSVSRIGQHGWSWRSNHKGYDWDEWNPIWNYNYAQILNYMINPVTKTTPNIWNWRQENSLRMGNTPNWNVLPRLNRNYKNNPLKYSDNNIKKSTSDNLTDGPPLEGSSNWIVNNSDNLNVLSNIAGKFSESLIEDLLAEGAIVLLGGAVGLLDLGIDIGAAAISVLANIIYNKLFPNLPPPNDGNGYSDKVISSISWKTNPQYYKSYGGHKDLHHSDRAFQIITTIELHDTNSAAQLYTTTKFTVVTYKWEQLSRISGYLWSPWNYYTLGMGNTIQREQDSAFLNGVYGPIKSKIFYDIADVANGDPINPMDFPKKYPDLHKMTIDYTIKPINKNSWGDSQCYSNITAFLKYSSNDYSFKNQQKKTIFLMNNPLLTKEIALNFTYHNPMIDCKFGESNVDLGQIVAGPEDDSSTGRPLGVARCWIMGNSNTDSSPVNADDYGSSIDIWVYRVKQENNISFS